MKKSKNKLSAVEKFQEDMQNMFRGYYSRQLSDNIKRGLKHKKEREDKKKLSTNKN